MRPMEVTFPEGAQGDLEKLLKREKKVRVFRRAQAILEVVKGKTVKETSETFGFANSALRKWIRRYVAAGTDGLQDLPRSGRPREVTEEIEELVVQLIDEDPLDHKSIYSQWTCSELARVVGEKTGKLLGPESMRRVLKKKGLAITAQPSN